MRILNLNQFNEKFGIRKVSIDDVKIKNDFKPYNIFKLYCSYYSGYEYCVLSGDNHTISNKHLSYSLHEFNEDLIIPDTEYGTIYKNVP